MILVSNIYCASRSLHALMAKHPPYNHMFIEKQLKVWRCLAM